MAGSLLGNISPGLSCRVSLGLVVLLACGGWLLVSMVGSSSSCMMSGASAASEGAVGRAAAKLDDQTRT